MISAAAEMISAAAEMISAATEMNCALIYNPLLINTLIGWLFLVTEGFALDGFNIDLDLRFNLQPFFNQHQGLHQVDTPNRDVLVEFCTDRKYVVGNTLEDLPTYHSTRNSYTPRRDPTSPSQP